MKIGIDLDGVVFDTEALWGVYAELYDCIELNRNSVIDNGEPRVQERYDWTEEEKNTYLDKYVNLKDFNLVPGAKEVIELLRKDGHELIVITARGALENQTNGVNIAEEKIKKEGLVFDKYYWKRRDKLDVCKEEKIDVMIEDNIHNCIAINGENIKTIYFNSLGRRHVINNDKITEVANWGEVYRAIKEFNVIK